MQSQLLPLDLPHILDTIFAFLDPYSLRHNISLVNRQWHHLAQHYLEPLSKLNEWSLAHLIQQPDLQEHFLDTLPDRSVLKISQQSNTDGQHGQGLMKHLSTTMTTTTIRIRTLHLDDVPAGEPWIYTSLLPRLGPLITTIRITRALWTSHQGNNLNTHPLGIMLLHCPQLRHFYISSTEEPSSIGHSTTPPNPAHSLDLAAELGVLKLQEFEIANMYIQQSVMEAVIARSPSLKVLRLVGIYGPDNAHVGVLSLRARIVRLIGETCPDLQVFHYSIRWHRLAKTDWTGFTSLTRNKGQSSGTFHPIHLSSPEEVVKQLDNMNLGDHAGIRDGSTVRTLSLFSTDLHRTIAPLIQPIVNMVTTLEIHPTARPPYSADVSLYFSHILHRFLCSSPLLLHLKVPLVRFHSAFLDLRGEVDSEGNYQVLPSLPYYPPMLRWTSKQIWACRRLVTLQLYTFGEDKQDAEEDARILFGYISRICPLLRDLSIQQQHLCVRMEGGLCLLSRLHYLERLSIISSGNNSGFSKHDLVWMKKSPPPTWDLPRFREPKAAHKEYRRQLGQFVQRSLTTFAKADPSRVQEMHRLYVKAKDPNQQLTVEDMDGVGSIEDLEAWRQFRHGYQLVHGSSQANGSKDENDHAPTGKVDLPYCWPSLQYLAFYRYQVPINKRRYDRYHQLRQEDLDALDQALWDEIKDIRPGVEVKCNRSLYYNAIYYIGPHGNPTHLASYGKPYVDF